MGSVRLGVPERLVMALRDRGDYTHFVETGTFKGGTATWAAERFDRVYTVEASRPRYEKTAAALAGEYKNLRMVFGDSRTVLPRWLRNDIMRPAIFWLDAHWVGDAASAHQSGDECPLLDELTAINSHFLAQFHAILIDDARYFLNKPAEPHDPAQWPTLADIQKIVKEVPGRELWVHEDVIVIVPVRLGSVVCDWVAGEL